MQGVLSPDFPTHQGRHPHHRRTSAHHSINLNTLSHLTSSPRSPAAPSAPAVKGHSLIPSSVFLSDQSKPSSGRGVGEHLHSLPPSPRQTLRCQMKLNTNIPRWLSYRAGWFGNTGSGVIFHLAKASRSPCPKGHTEFHGTD